MNDMNNEFDYYLLRNSFKGGRVPRLKVDDTVNPSGTAFLSFYRPVPDDYVAHLCFGPPIPADPTVDTDAMALGGACRVFSRKIYDAVNLHHFKGLQFVPAVIRGLNGQEFREFYVANVCRTLFSFDEQKTQFDSIDDFTGAWFDIEKIVLDRTRLAEIPLEERLVFVAKEHPAYIPYHRTIVDAMMSVEPDGLVATPVEEWEEGMQFR